MRAMIGGASGLARDRHQSIGSFRFDARHSITVTTPELIPMIHVVAVITAKPGQRAQLLEAFAANRAAVLAEEGCIEYGATVDAQGVPTSKASFGPDTFVVIEKWETLAHLQAHAVAPHMKDQGAGREQADPRARTGLRGPAAALRAPGNACYPRAGNSTPRRDSLHGDLLQAARLALARFHPRARCNSHGRAAGRLRATRRAA